MLLHLGSSTCFLLSSASSLAPSPLLKMAAHPRMKTKADTNRYTKLQPRSNFLNFLFLAKILHPSLQAGALFHPHA